MEKGNLSCNMVMKTYIFIRDGGYMDKKRTMKIWGIIGVFIIVFIGVFTWYYQKNYRDPSLFLIPQGFVGRVEVQYGIPSSPPLQKEGKYIVYKIPKDGILKTSTKEPQYGIAEDVFYYVDEQGNQTKKLDTAEEIHGYNIGNHEVIKEDEIKNIHTTKESFLVGTESQLTQWRKKEGAPLK